MQIQTVHELCIDLAYRCVVMCWWGPKVAATRSHVAPIVHGMWHARDASMLP